MERLLNALREAGWTVAGHQDTLVRGRRQTEWTFLGPGGRTISGAGATDAEALNVIAQKAGMDTAATALDDAGPWIAGADGERTYLQSADFTHDVRLYVDGDFKNAKDRLSYARNLAAALNKRGMDPKPRGRGIKALLSAFALFVVLCTAAWRHEANANDDRAEAGPSAYADASSALSTCPSERSSIRASLKDKRITVAEARVLYSRLSSAASLYQKSKALAEAKRSLSIETPPLPDTCSNVVAEELGPPRVLFGDYDAY